MPDENKTDPELKTLLEKAGEIVSSLDDNLAHIMAVMAIAEKKLTEVARNICDREEPTDTDTAALVYLEIAINCVNRANKGYIEDIGLKFQDAMN